MLGRRRCEAPAAPAGSLCVRVSVCLCVCAPGRWALGAAVRGLAARVHECRGACCMRAARATAWATERLASCMAAHRRPVRGAAVSYSTPGRTCRGGRAMMIPEVQRPES
jgi:hypothetical protein